MKILQVGFAKLLVRFVIVELNMMLVKVTHFLLYELSVIKNFIADDSEVLIVMPVSFVLLSVLLSILSSNGNIIEQGVPYRGTIKPYETQKVS